MEELIQINISQLAYEYIHAGACFRRGTHNDTAIRRGKIVASPARQTNV